MSLIDALGYEVVPQAGLRRGFSELATNAAVAAVIANTAMTADRLVLGVTRGRWTATSLMAGFPVLWLTTTGAKSGESREVPLLGIPTPSRDLAVLGTNFGRNHTPAWVHNLVADPTAFARWRTTTLRVKATQLDVAAEEPVWDAAIAAYPNFANYRARASHRTIRVFELSVDR